MRYRRYVVTIAVGLIGLAGPTVPGIAAAAPTPSPAPGPDTSSVDELTDMVMAAIAAQQAPPVTTPVPAPPPN